MRRLLPLVAALWLLCPHLPAAQDCTRNMESGFSYCPPEGWTIKPDMKDKFKLFLAPAVAGFTPNINVKDEENTLSLEEHVAANIRTMVNTPEKAGAQTVTLLTQTEFVTASGEHGVRLAMRVVFQNLTIRALQYYFKLRGNQKIVLSCLALETAKDTYDPIFDRAAKTLRVDH